MKRIINLMLCSVVVTLFVSCSAGYVETEPTYVEVARPVAPYPHYVYVNDNYVWRNRAYVHQNGYWVKPRPNRTYVQGNWNREPRGYRWQKGRWK